MIYPKDNTVVDAYPSTNFKDHFVIIGYEIARNGRPQSFYKDSLFEIPPSITAEIEECLTREFQEV